MGPCCCAWCAEQEDRASRFGNSSAPSVPMGTLIHSIPGGLAVISTEKIAKEYLKLKDLTDNLLYLLTQTRSYLLSCKLCRSLTRLLKTSVRCIPKSFPAASEDGRVVGGVRNVRNIRALVNSSVFYHTYHTCSHRPVCSIIFCGHVAVAAMPLAQECF